MIKTKMCFLPVRPHVIQWNNPCLVGLMLLLTTGFGVNNPVLGTEPQQAIAFVPRAEIPSPIVTSTSDAVADDGATTLREAINYANTNPGTTVSFRIPSAQAYGNVFRIRPTGQLPSITANGTVIDGHSQRLFTGDTNEAGPEIVLNGSLLSATADGLIITAANCVVKGLVINDFDGNFENPHYAVRISGVAASNNHVEGCYIGTDSAGTRGQWNDNAIYIVDAPDNTIGGTTPAQRNVITGQFWYGVYIYSTNANYSARNNVVQGNYIGTNAAGTGVVAPPMNEVLSLGNSVGIFLQDAPGTLVGGTTPGARNVIGNNSNHALWIYGPGTVGTIIQGNHLGTDVTGTIAIPNNHGMLMDIGTTNNIIGGAATGAGNLISGNRGIGVWMSGPATTGNIVQGNRIGTNAAGTGALPNRTGVQVQSGSRNNTIGGTTAGAANRIAFNTQDGVCIQANYYGIPVGNSIRGNSIFSNGAMGINLRALEEAESTITPNDPGDFDGDANNLQNAPVITSVADSGSVTTVTGTLNSKAGKNYIIDFYSVQPDPNGYGEGENYLGSQSVTTDSSGNVAFTFIYNSGISGKSITATATNATLGEPGDTSEFSRAVKYSTPPTISAIPDRTILQDTSSVTIPFTVGDAQTPAADLTLRIAWFSDGPLISRSVFGGSGTNRNVTLTPVAGRSGVATVYITVSDGGDGSGRDDGSTSTRMRLTVIARPTITGFTPAEGVVGTAVTINGTGFTGATAVKFNGANATFTVTSATEISANVPAGATSGPISVVTPGGTATSAASFTVIPSYMISGRIATSDGRGIAGVSVTRTGSSTPAVTNTNGDFNFGGLPNGSYTITPGKNNYAFTPATRTVSVNGANVGGQSFTGTANYSIIGRIANNSGVGIANIQVARSGSGSAMTNANGDYIFTAVPVGTYAIAPIITPALNGVTLYPASRNVTIGSSNVGNQNFTASFSVNGRVANHSGVGIPNVQVKRTAGTSVVSTFTDSNGNYRFTDVRSGSYSLAPVLTPAMAGMTFTPTVLDITVDRSNITNQNFIGMFSISGRATTSTGVALPNVLVRLSTATSSTTVLTDTNGNYQFRNVRSGTYTLAASQTGKTFVPASRSVAVGTLSLTNENFISS